MPSLFDPAYLQIVTVPVIAGLAVWLLGGIGRWLTRLLALVATAWMLVVAVMTLANLSGAADVAGPAWFSCGIFQLGLALHLDALRALLLTGVSLFAFLVALYSVRAAEDLPKERRYWAFVLWAAAAAAAVLMADNLWLLLIAWEVVTVMLYLLANYGQAEARKGAFKTFAVLGFADAALLMGVVMLLYHVAPTGTIPAMHAMQPVPANSASMVFCYVLLLVAGLAKAGSMPLHTWVPAMAEKTPAVVFAFLPASLDKLLGIFLIAIVGLKLFAIGGTLQMILMVIGSATILCAVLMAMVQHNLKRLLSFHAVSQVGYMVLGLGTGNPVGVLGGLFHMVNNAIYKSGLFLMAGSVEDETGTAELDRLGGLARRMPVTFWCGVVAALAISGVPPLNGFVSKWLVYQGVLERAQQDNAVLVFLIVAVFGSALTLASFVKVLHGVFLGAQPEGLVLSGRARSVWRAVPMIVLSALCLALGIFAATFVQNWMLPAVSSLNVDTSSIEAAGGTLTTTTQDGTATVGWWSPNMGTALIIVGIILGLVLYLATRAMKVRVTPTFVGGEQPRATARFSGPDFYETIRNLPLLRAIYGDAEAGAFDGYRLTGQAGQGLVDILRSWHGGLLPVYVAWVLFGLLASVLWLLLA
jgi:formate hydrogenlyase subunit 3/multisubunit Na+/H+ antiporter MnhD subunit